MPKLEDIFELDDQFLLSPHAGAWQPALISGRRLSDRSTVVLKYWKKVLACPFALADIEASVRRKAESKVAAPISPLALEIVQCMDRLFEIERSINGKSAEEQHRTK